MANKVLIHELDGTPKQIVFRDSTDFAPTAANDLRDPGGSGNYTLVQWLFESVANNGYRQSTKVDLGSLRGNAYHVRASLEFGATPTAGNTCDFYWAPSSNSTAGTGNSGGVSGADSAYTGYSSNGDASVKQLLYIGSFICTAQATGTIQTGEVGVFTPPERYGSLVVKNASGATMHTDSAEHHVVFDPVTTEIQ